MKYILLAFALCLSACTTTATAADDAHKAAHDEPRPYDKTHDSRGLAAQFEKPRFQTLLRNHYKMTYVDVGQKNRNIDLARTFGVDNIVGTPTVFVTNSNGEVLNLDTAPTWRNAASREEDDIYDYFRSFADKGAAPK